MWKMTLGEGADRLSIRFGVSGHDLCGLGLAARFANPPYLLW